jgi:hypothetical protein
VIVRELRELDLTACDPQKALDHIRAWRQQLGLRDQPEGATP